MAGRSIGRASCWSKSWVLGASLLLGVATCTGAAQAASTADRIFTIGNYPVEARAENAVAAKERAIKDGQQAAFRSLLKRLVPVTAYKRLGALKGAFTPNLVESFAVRSERNSSTEYIASYDFAFAPGPVRQLLEQAGIPYLDRQAPSVTIVPTYRLPPELAGRLPRAFSNASGSDAWLYAWKALDLTNTLSPATIQPLKAQVHADTIKALAEGDLGMLRTLASEYRSETVVLAVLEPQADQKRIKVILAGRDAVQPIYLKRIYRLDGGDLAYTAELAAVISLAILEGRWKAINTHGTAAPPVNNSSWSASTSQGNVPSGVQPGVNASAITVGVEFQGMGEWQHISRQIAQTPQVSGLDVLGLSARRARISLYYPGGYQGLALALANQGLTLQQTQYGWVVTRR